MTFERCVYIGNGIPAELGSWRGRSFYGGASWAMEPNFQKKQFIDCYDLKSKCSLYINRHIVIAYRLVV